MVKQGKQGLEVPSSMWVNYLDTTFCIKNYLDYFLKDQLGTPLSSQSQTI